jgi:hypothetical protein
MDDDRRMLHKVKQAARTGQNAAVLDFGRYPMLSGKK